MDRAGIGTSDEGLTGADWVEENGAIPFVRWSARVLGVLTAGFFLFMFIGESWGRGWPEPSFGMFLPFAYVVAMFLALRKERAGALIGGAALGALFISLYVKFGFSPARGILNPFLLLFWLPVLLYLLRGGLESRDRRRRKTFI